MAGIVLFVCLIALALVIRTEDALHRIEINELKRKHEAEKRRGEEK